MTGIRWAQEADAMDSLQELLEVVAKNKLAHGNFRGLLHALIGRKVFHADKLVSSGLTWRETAALLRKLRWDVEVVREFGVDPDHLPPRDREKFWYSAIAQAGVDSEDAARLADKFAENLKKHGYEVKSAAGK